jgi:hypothetical protein
MDRARPRRYTPFAEALDESQPPILLIDWVDVVIGSDNRAQIGAERDSDRRTIVDGTNTHLERPVSGALSLLCKSIHEIRVDVPLAQDAGAFSGDAEQIARACLVDL